MAVSIGGENVWAFCFCPWFWLRFLGVGAFDWVHASTAGGFWLLCDGLVGRFDLSVGLILGWACAIIFSEVFP